MPNLTLLMVLSLFHILAWASGQNEKIPTQAIGWLGADGAHAVKVPPDGRIWVFNDSFVGELKGGKRIEGKIVRNSVAMETAGVFEYYWGNDQDGFFKNSRPDEWYWPSGANLFNNQIYVILKRVKKTNSDDTFGFKYRGTDLAIIENFRSDFKNWSVNYLALPLSNSLVAIATSFHRNYLYLLADFKNREHSLFLARIKLSEVQKGRSALIKYYKPTQRSWEKSFIEADPVILNGSPEASLRYDHGLWRIVFTPGGLAKDIVSIESKSILGPWTNRKVLFSCGEMDWNTNYYCYSAKEVPGESFQVSYNVNSFDFLDISRDPRIYIPRIIEVKD